MINRVNMIITHKCNLNCKHCYMNLKNQKQLNDDVLLKKIKETIKFLNNNGVEEIMFTGGEVFTFKYLKEILHYSKSLGIKNIIFTNAMIFDESCLEFIDQVNISLDGSRKNHNEIRGNEKSYDNVIKLLDKLKDADVWTTLQVSINKENINDLKFLPMILLSHLNIRTVNLVSIINEGNALENNISCDIETSKKVLQMLPELYDETKYHFQFRTSLISKYDFINCYINELPIFPIWVDIIDDEYYLIKDSDYRGKIKDFNNEIIEKMCYNIQQKFIEKNISDEEYVDVEYEMTKLV